jgi:signal transduction histidine kinase
LPSWPLTAEVRHNLFLTVKEAFNNVAKHSRASEARLKIQADDSILEICIEDDGVGFPIAGASDRRNGLANMKDRIREVGGALEISSGPKGTRISLRVPVQSNKVTFAKE